VGLPQTKYKVEYLVATLITGYNSAGPLQWGFLKKKKKGLYQTNPPKDATTGSE